MIPDSKQLFVEFEICCIKNHAATELQVTKLQKCYKEVMDYNFPPLETLGTASGFLNI